ncbi:MAG: DUF3379 family protein [Gammaproteobacteria bacterium]
MDDMNCLAARRIITTDITDKSNAFVQHVASCSTCKSFYEKQLKFNAVLKKAVDIDVPEGLASRILVEHSLNKRKQGNQKYRWSAIAASVMLVFAVSIVSTFNTQPAIAGVILEHAHDELWVLEDKDHVTLESLNQLLKPHGVKADDNIGYATHAGNCIIQGKVGVHIVFAGENAPVTLIVFPEPLDHKESVRISDHFFKGVLMGTNKGTLALLSEDEESLKKFEARLNTSLMTFI